jgi:hypothetical protein
MIRARRAPRRGVARGLRLAGLLSLAALPLLRAPPALAYVRYMTSTGHGFFWPQTCVPVSVYPASMMDANGNMEMTLDEIVHATTAAASAWSGGQNACTYLEINVTTSDATPPKAGLDYTNAVLFRVQSWSYAAEALAITSVFVDKADGRIIDGDIEVNDKNFEWTDLDLDPAAKKQDLQNALTHEMGHLIGLDHTCFANGTPGPVPTDNNGNEIPNCDNAPAAVQATTMFASAIPGDTAKRTLEPDDIQGVCDIYPVADNPQRCPAKDEPPQKPGCALAPSGRGGIAPLGRGDIIGLVSVAALALAARRRRGRRT